MAGKTRSGAMLAVVALLGLGCSFSWSSDSISNSSDSISNSSDSFSKSSSESSPDGKSDEAAYREDVKDLTAVHLRSGGGPDGLLRDLGSVALRHGVNDWEADPSTFVGVGEGLALAAASPEQVEIYQRSLAQGDTTRLAALRRGQEVEQAR